MGRHLIEISSVVLQLEGKTVTEIFGTPDDLKVHYCMTLFATVENAHPEFSQVLGKYFNRSPEEATLWLLVKNKLSNKTL